MSVDEVLIETDGPFRIITMNRPERRNALSLSHMRALTAAFRRVAETGARGIVLAGNGPVFSAGHDFADLAGADLARTRELLLACRELMDTIHAVPQVVIAQVHGMATAAGCQLVAACDLAVAARNARFAAPGGKGGWFCHTPMVPIARTVGRKRAMEMALTGDAIDAGTALDWGLINRAVPEEELEKATRALLERATQGSPRSKALGKQAMYAQLDRPEADAYTYAIEVMAAASQTPEAQEGMRAFLDKRAPEWPA
ncbi:enoyl-CoA hydratase-related protein [Actinoallomurus spadix]|uniref:Enoyl-CoA hydratase domain-containing protein 3, mitochondrial n=1 Tax=Actinoallomurus spadix TaxID=79912 RepID=A0ABN0WLU7_9ACTN|nr:enoyl-CoA hydratase-related protein [Actinoallomurus spadix]MCO5984560.1 enoyl-CoA hydratase-related protein [Actinoallomurus spadix]